MLMALKIRRDINKKNRRNAYSCLDLSIYVIKSPIQLVRQSLQLYKPKYYLFPFTDNLKGPKHEIFERFFFTEIRPVRIGDLGTGEKK